MSLFELPKVGSQGLGCPFRLRGPISPCFPCPRQYGHPRALQRQLQGLWGIAQLSLLLREKHLVYLELLPKPLLTWFFDPSHSLLLNISITLCAISLNVSMALHCKAPSMYSHFLYSKI